VTLPIMTPGQRADALAKAKLANAERARVKAGLKAGATTLADVLDAAADNEPLAKMKVSALLTALPGIGKVKAAHLMDGLGIKENRRVRGLSARQREALETVFASVPGV
jgi:hypothetical protein